MERATEPTEAHLKQGHMSLPCDLNWGLWARASSLSIYNLNKVNTRYIWGMYGV